MNYKNVKDPSIYNDWHEDKPEDKPQDKSDIQ